MAKRSTRRRHMEADRFARDQVQDSKIARLYPVEPQHTNDNPPGWRPEDVDQARPRDQKYVKNVTPKSAGQKRFMTAMDEKSLVMALGPAGSGKTYLAIAKAVEALEKGAIGRIVLSRPAIEAGESIGFLPGAMEDKLAPYLRPLYDALQDRLSSKKLKALMAEGLIEIAPVGYMRGRTLNNAFIVIDEAQNCTYAQLKMLLTRLGWHSTMVVTGDPNQSDLLPELSGLKQVADKLKPIEGAGIVTLDRRDIVRHPLVADMLTVL